MVKHTQTIRRPMAKHHFVGLALKGLSIKDTSGRPKKLENMWESKH